VVTGLWAVAFWTVAAGDLALQANQPNTEVFLTACLIWAFAGEGAVSHADGRARQCPARRDPKGQRR
jgi:hypothetical protein